MGNVIVGVVPHYDGDQDFAVAFKETFASKLFYLGDND